MRSRQRDEQGAVAIMVGMMAVLLVSVCALVVDLSNAYVQKNSMQRRADFSALAGGAGNNLPTTAGGSVCAAGSWTAPKATDQAVLDVQNYLNGVPGGNVTAAQLVDCDLANGEAAYGTWGPVNAAGVRPFTANKNQISVISQPARVNFGFAQVMGFKNVDVGGEATAEIKTKLQSTLPLYAFSGCDYGQQTIAQPSNGKASGGVNLSYMSNSDGSNDFITETALTTDPYVADPPTVQVNSTGAKITVTGTNLDLATQLGFFQSRTSSPPEPVVVPKASFVSQTATSITVNVPTAVSTVQDSWFVRLYGPDAGNGNPKDMWTSVTDKNNANANANLQAQLVIVGVATLSCAQGSTAGNFGTLKLARDGNSDPNAGGQTGDIARNIAFGLQHGLAPYPGAAPDFSCVDGQGGVAHVWPYEGTNCVGTKTGLDSDAAEQGFILGIDGKPGLLGKTTNGTGCMGGNPATATVDGKLINNDVLSCFFTNSTVTVGEVMSPSYSGPAVIDQTIYKSPRFVLVPVLGAGPSSGSSNNYEIVDFRAGFITDQGVSATKSTGPTADNGISWNGSTGNSKLQAVVVDFINPAALPDPPLDANGKYIPYVGTGKKSLLLVQ